ncbi:MAG: sulfotransferase [Actinomycetota bacterium]|nr:sulfotransferase [Actinomycetota bacterium]
MTQPRRVSPGRAPDDARPRPRFICVGAGKAGTTWLWEMLRRHPDVFLPEIKEIHYFNDIAYEGSDIRNPNYGKPLDWYLRHFSPARPDQVCGEITPSYLWNEQAALRIHEFDPDIRIIVMLRDPVERLFSSYLFGQQKGEIGRISFEHALERIDYLLQRSTYCRSLRRYLDRFDPVNVKVVFHEDLLSDPVGLLEDVQRFIGVRPDAPADVAERRNVTGESRYPGITTSLMSVRIRLKRHGLEWLVPVGNTLGLGALFRFFQSQVRPYDVRPAVSRETEERLRLAFLDDVECLEALLGVDLSRWKPSTPGS